MICTVLAIVAHCQFAAAAPVALASDTVDRGAAVVSIGGLDPTAVLRRDSAVDSLRYMPVGEITDSPLGFRDMCLRDPRECVLTGAGGAADRLSQEQIMGLLGATNRRINRKIRWRADIGADTWERPHGNHPYGDCEDFAIAKRDELVAAGLAPDKMFLAIGYLSGAGLHAVLIVRTGQGDMVLDSLREKIVAWNETRYVWVMRETAASSTEWRLVP